ncbi:hypothetical protein B0T11DRAFT_293815 [Plectosphaerella cucumerina]|uniref:Zn(2)-C6 fungal-type domain-containing protein n=1 Tax=Plectosphaerella cucumerina TaxID=40658 RepID=A0A8K0X8X3_9PEZI|nr:hypothetical protein B0T11DRAFT_293815 [Plectosphaerella cucumerina]
MSASAASLPPISTRRRACTACQQAKRRCDQRLPRCGRCVQKGLGDCHYPSLEATVAAADFNFFTDMLSGAQTPLPAQPPHQQHHHQHHHQTQALDHLPTSIGHAIPSETATYWQQLPPAFYSPSGSPSNLNSIVARDAIQYSNEQFRTYPRRWVAQNGYVPFIHPALYLSPPTLGGHGITPDAQLPLILQDCFCACAAYAAKNDENGDLVMGIVESKATALLASFTFNDNSWPLTEQVAALQALVMYQMIRWFDGDIRQRVLADAIEPVLAAWTSALQARVGSSVFSTSTQPEEGASTVPPSPPSAFPEPSTSPFANANPFFSSYEQQSVPQPAAMPIPDFSAVGTAPGGSPRVRTPTGSVSTTPNSTRSMTKEDLRLAWRRWLLAESIRRVVIASHLVREVYATARQGGGSSGSNSGPTWAPTTGGFDGSRSVSPPGGTGNCPLQDMSFTAAARLWSASTPEQWRRAVSEASYGAAGPRWWWVERMDFSGVFGSPDPSQVDEFALLVGVVVKGREVVEDWLAQTGRARRV